MHRILAYIIITLNIIFAFSTISAKAIYTFADPNKEQHFYHYIDTIRCLVCQNESIKDSNAPLADQLRQLIYERMQVGETDQAITDYLRSRYGDFVEYTPKPNKLTMALWLLPVLLLIIGIYLLQKRQQSC